MTDPVTALIAVDVQRDFLPGGSLAVHEGEAVVGPLLRLAERVATVVASRDFHPPHHVSFTERGGPWPVHCVAGTPGAEIHPDIDRVAALVVSKGTDPDLEAYSGFDGTHLAGILRALGVRKVLIGGLATDYCVRATALAALREGFAATVVTDAIRAVDTHPHDGERAVREMQDSGVRVASLAELGIVATS